MKSNHSAARAHLERAYDHLCGNDNTSRQAREALDLLIEAMAIAEYSHESAQIVLFHSKKAER
jgi:undecaprenyl pyrophosphate synthase